MLRPHPLPLPDAHSKARSNFRATAAVSGGDCLHRPGAHAAHIPPRYRTLVLLRNYLHRYQIIRKVLKSFQITFKVTLAKYNFDQRRESSFWHFVHK